MGRIKGELAEGYVRINGEKIKAELKKRYVSMKSLSIFVLDQDPSTLRYQLTHGSMHEDKFKKLMEYLKIPEKKRNDFLDIEEVEVPVPKTEAHKESTNHEALDLLVVGVNTLYETQTDGNKLLKDILQELKVSNQKLERIEKKVNTIENATGQILSKEIISNETSDDILKNLQDVKSTVNIIKGRTTDINDLCKKRNFKAV